MSVRLLDSYVGRAICAAFSTIHKLRVRRPEVNEVRNVLVIELFEMGAAIMSYPSLRYIRDKFPDANIHCLTLKSVAPSWRCLGIIPEQNVSAIEDHGAFAFAHSLLKQVLRLRRVRFDIIIDLSLFIRITAIISYMLRSKCRAGFHAPHFEGLYRGTFLDFACTFNQNAHVSKNFLALTMTAVNQRNDEPNFKGPIDTSHLHLPRYESDTVLKTRLEGKISRSFPEYRGNQIFTVSHDVGSNLPMRNYPSRSLATVIRMLLERYPDHVCVLIGATESAQRGEEIARLIADPRCINMSGQTDRFEELLELLGMSRLLITNDNGPAHFAALTNTKTVALFSTDSPHMYGPLGKCVVLYSFYHCSPCISAYNHKYSSCIDNKCLQAISPGQVFELAARFLEDRATPLTINGVVPYV